MNRAAVREAIRSTMASLPALRFDALRKLAPHVAARVDEAEAAVNEAAKRLLQGDDKPSAWADLDRALQWWRAVLEGAKRALTGQRN